MESERFDIEHDQPDGVGRTAFGSRVRTNRQARPTDGSAHSVELLRGQRVRFPVSGWGTVGATFLSVEQSGPPLFTGGSFGPEAGILTIAASIVGVLVTMLWVRVRTGRVTLQTSLAEPPTA